MILPFSLPFKRVFYPINNNNIDNNQIEQNPKTKEKIQPHSDIYIQSLNSTAMSSWNEKIQDNK